MSTRVRYWLLRHPQVSRPLIMVGWLQLLAGTAVCTAPGAAASTNAVVLNWTGLHDSYGVPIGDFYLSLASLHDQLIEGGPDAQAFNPSAWAPWLLHGLKVFYTTFTAANILTAEAGVFVGIIALSLWVMRLTVSSYWLAVFGEIAKAVTSAVITVTTRWGLVALTVPVGVFVGVLAIRRGEAGRGATMILTAILMPALTLTVFADPAGMMYGPDGLLMFGRRMGFDTAQAVTRNGAISGTGLNAQVDTLTSSLITHVVREPLEVFNFGHVTDRVGSCAAQYSAALQHGATVASVQGTADDPVKAMAHCGDMTAVYYAQNLDGTNVFAGLILVLAATLFGWFMVSSGASVLMVSVKALYTTAKLVPSVLAGGVAGAAQQHAKVTVWRFFKHPLEAMVLITFVSVMGLAVERLLSRPLPPELGGTSPFAHILIMGGASMTALYLLRHIRADLHGQRPGSGILGRAGDVALGMGLRAAAGGAGRATLGGARGLRRSLDGAGKTPWERLDEAAATQPGQVLGPPLDGFAPVPAEPTSMMSPSADATNDNPPGAQDAITTPDPHGAGRAPLTAATDSVHLLQRSRTGTAPATIDAQAFRADESTPQTAATAGIPPISAGPTDQFSHGGTDASPPMGFVDHTDSDIPLPPEPPAEDPHTPPPPDPAPRALPSIPSPTARRQAQQ